MIRFAKKTDLEQVAIVHRRCFNGSYSSQLSKFIKYGGAIS